MSSIHCSMDIVILRFYLLPTVVRNTGRKIVRYSRFIADKEALLNEDVEEESTDEVFSDNPKEIENQNTYVTRFFCCLASKEK